MPIWSKVFGGLRALFHRREAEQEMEEELCAFLQASAERKMQAGMSATEANRAARVEMGSVESVKEAIRAVGWEGAVEALWTDVRYSVRVLAKAPLFTSMVMLTLALGIGANTAIFSLMNSLLLKALPVEKPEELMEVSGSGRMGDSGDYVSHESFMGTDTRSTGRILRGLRLELRAVQSRQGRDDAKCRRIVGEWRLLPYTRPASVRGTSALRCRRSPRLRRSRGSQLWLLGIPLRSCRQCHRRCDFA